MTIKERLLALLTERADRRGRVYDSAESICRALGLSGHDLAKNLHQLYKEGHIDLKWKKTGNDWRIKKIRVR